MTNEEWATILNGREYRNEVTDDEQLQMAAEGIVAAFAQSDDILRMVGAIDDEFYDCTPVSQSGAPVNMCEEGCPYFEEKVKDLPEVDVDWQKWEDFFIVNISNDVPHARFSIQEDGDQYCEGIVFSLKDLPND